nr:hypothetical protein [Tanacetum cinerariifolium]
MRERELKEIQDEDTSPSEITSEIRMEVEGFEPPHEEEAHVRRSARTHRAPECLCLNVEAEEHSLGELNELANYKAALLYPESDKLTILLRCLGAGKTELDAMSVEKVMKVTVFEFTTMITLKSTNFTLKLSADIVAK